MGEPEVPKVHCIALTKPSINLVHEETEWRLCRVFSTLSKSNQRIHREKNATRRYKPVLAFSVSNPSDTDRQTLNFNKGVIKDRLGFAVNSKTVTSLIPGVLDKGTQWVLTTDAYLKQISSQEHLSVDTFFENDFDVTELEGSLPRLFKLSPSNRPELVFSATTELVMTDQSKPTQAKKVRSGQDKSVTTEKETSDLNKPTTNKSGKPVKKRKNEKGKAHNTIDKLDQTESENIPKTHPSIVTVGCDTVLKEPKGAEAVLPKLGVETKTSDRQKREHSAGETHDTTFIGVMIPKIKDEPLEYDYKPYLKHEHTCGNLGTAGLKSIVKKEFPKCDFETKFDVNDKSLAATHAQLTVKVKEFECETKCKKVEENLEAPSHNLIGKVKEEGEKFDYEMKCEKNKVEENLVALPPTLIGKEKEEVEEFEYETKCENVEENLVAPPQCLIGKVKEEVEEFETKCDRVDENPVVDFLMLKVKEEKIGDFNVKKKCNTTDQNAEGILFKMKKEIHEYDHTARNNSRMSETQTISNLPLGNIKELLPSSPISEKRGNIPEHFEETNSLSTLGLPKTTGHCLVIQKGNGKVLERVNDSKSKCKLTKKPGENMSSFEKGGQSKPITSVEKLQPTKQDRSLSDRKAVSTGNKHQPSTGNPKDTDKDSSVSKTTLKVIIPKLYIEPSQHSSNERQESIERDLEIRYQNRSDQNVRTSQLKKVLPTKAKTTNPQLKRCKPDASKEKPEKNKKKKTSKVKAVSKCKPFPADEKNNKSKALPKSIQERSEKNKPPSEFANKTLTCVGKIPDSTTAPKRKIPEEDHTLNKGVFKASSSKENQANREDPSSTRKHIAVRETRTEPKGKNLSESPQSPRSSPVSTVVPPSTGLELLGSLNTVHSFLFDKNQEKNQGGMYNLLNAALQRGVGDDIADNETPSLNHETCSTVANNADLKRNLDGDSKHGDTKRKRTEGQHKESLSEVPSSTYMSKSDELKVACTTKMHRGNERSDLQKLSNQRPVIDNPNKKQKTRNNAQRDVTLIVGDSMLQHIQPEKFFKRKHVVVKTLPGARVGNIYDYIPKFLKQESPTDVILHIGTNDLHKGTMHIATRIEFIGKRITESFPSVKKFTISSVIQRSVDITGAKFGDASEVNKVLENMKSEHGWDYINNDNIDPEVHVGPDGIHLNASGIEAFAANFKKHLGLVESNPTPGCSGPSVAQTGQSSEQVMSKDTSSFTTSLMESSHDDSISSRTQDLSDDVHDITCEDTHIAATSDSQNCLEISKFDDTNDDDEKVSLIIGDLMLESIIPNRLARKRKVEMIVVPDARVDNIGKVVSKHARNPNIDEVILHVGSNDLKDNVYDQKEIASKIEEIGKTLQTSFPNITTFTVSGVIKTFQHRPSTSENLNNQLKSVTSDHGWSYIDNGNIHPKSHTHKFDHTLNDFGTRRFARNIISHMRSQSYSDPWRHQGECQQEFMVSRKSEQMPYNEQNTEESQGYKHDNGRKAQNRHFDDQTNFFAENRPGQSQRYPHKHPDRRRNNTGFAKTQSGRFYERPVPPFMGRPCNGKLRPHEAHYQDHPRWGSDQDLPLRPRPVNKLFPNFSGCYSCGGFDHKKRDCLKNEQTSECFYCGAVGHKRKDCPNRK